MNIVIEFKPNYLNIALICRAACLSHLPPLHEKRNYKTGAPWPLLSRPHRFLCGDSPRISWGLSPIGICLILPKLRNNRTKSPCPTGCLPIEHRTYNSFAQIKRFNFRDQILFQAFGLSIQSVLYPYQWSGQLVRARCPSSEDRHRQCHRPYSQV